MAFVLKKGKALLEHWPKKTSTTLTAGSLAQFDGSGFITICTAAPTRVAGVLTKSVASTDSDYATATVIPLIYPGPDCEFEADVTGTLTTAMLGVRYAPTSVGSQVDVANTTTPVLTCMSFISATKGMFKVSAAYLYTDAAT